MKKGGSILSHARLIISILLFFNSFLASTFLLSSSRLLLLLLVCRTKVDYVCCKIGAVVHWVLFYPLFIHGKTHPYTHTHSKEKIWAGVAGQVCFFINEKSFFN
jgi:hypothetical protein